MRTIIAVGGIILLLASAPAHAAYFIWPWQHHARHHRVQSDTDQGAPPDCPKINAVVKSMSAVRYERALGKLTATEQKIIADCEAQP
jgi:hypothetical protein